MNQLDLAFLVGCVLAAIGGFRLGLIRRVTGWIGLVVGLAVMSRVLPSIISTPPHPVARDLIKSLALIVVGGVAGQAIGLALGTRLRRLVRVAQLGVLDAVAGSAIGILGVVIAAWMVIPTMVQIPGWPADAARGSEVAARLTRALGQPPDLLAGVGKSLGIAGLPEALQSVHDLNVQPVAPTGDTVPAGVVASVRRSVVKLSGPACDRLQSGSGFVIAPGVVATNAHVVAGSESLEITGDDGLDVTGTIRYLDVRNDIALVSAPDLDRPPLALVAPKRDATGAILGYPGGGPLVVQPYTVASTTRATSHDIYDRDTFSRSILILGSRIGPGDSGGPLVDRSGAVAGIAFGIAPDDDQTAYAVPSTLLNGLVAKMSAEPLRSGACRGE
ncbi:MAG: CvpA family protein [Acidimicrobiales bacterium]